MHMDLRNQKYGEFPPHCLSKKKINRIETNILQVLLEFCRNWIPSRSICIEFFRRRWSRFRFLLNKIRRFRFLSLSVEWNFFVSNRNLQAEHWKIVNSTRKWLITLITHSLPWSADFRRGFRTVSSSMRGIWFKYAWFNASLAHLIRPELLSTRSLRLLRRTSVLFIFSESTWYSIFFGFETFWWFLDSSFWSKINKPTYKKFTVGFVII